MKFDELDRRLRVFETAHDVCVLPQVYMVARLDGRSFTRLTKQTLPLERPFDVRFRDAMLETTQHLMSVGFRVLYAYAQSDEISLLIDRDETLFGRKLRKIQSVLAGEASARLSLALGTIACFDCRVSALPTRPLVIDYFRWRQEDAHRNALNAHCYWRLRQEGASGHAAHTQVAGYSLAQKNEFLFTRGVNVNDLPAWQRRGTGVYWREEPQAGIHPVTGEPTRFERRHIHVDPDLPMKEAYADYVAHRIPDTL
ncbi:tRNA(His) guanylyltransferase Thg1 family protein [Tahibacter amnicola]|uniref:tRNA(His) guanylyltransferase n=1 Tax=Tahibacter amnicola TaxID=2976241 RepID=A0ABY6BD63_9GAMM|nr:tRNA(His) guanylyltransferase Thg1 family protein [Tahibacter amnicola]UXI67984.1 hypothetical protein N4264_25195 [Tahibacter amnicola]